MKKIKLLLTILILAAIAALCMGCEDSSDAGSGSGDTSITSSMVLVEGGSFSMGSMKNVREQPVRTVTLSPFYMGATEVTQGQWEAVMGTTWPGAPDEVPNAGDGNGDTYPAYSVSWFDALMFCNALSVRENLQECYVITKTDSDSVQTSWEATCDFTKNGYRLPTEAEWEYAAGGGATNRTEWAGIDSDTNLDTYAWYSANSGDGGGDLNDKTHIVKDREPNSLDLYDMSGNVSEWCWDWYGDNYNDLTKDNPTGAESGTLRVLRGGSFSMSLT